MGITIEIGGRNVFYLRINWMAGYGWSTCFDDGMRHIYLGKIHIGYERGTFMAYTRKSYTDLPTILKRLKENIALLKAQIGDKR